MKRMMIVLAIVIGLFCPVQAKAEVLNIEATAYCTDGITSTGEHTVEGITLAGCPRWYGKTVWVFEDKGNGIQVENLIGCYICTDTGSSRIRNGEVVDIFISDYNRAIEFGRKKVYVYIDNA